MKSLQLNTYPPLAKDFSDLRVLKSNAGYYIGSLYNDGEMEVPGTRDSNYFEFKADAEDFLNRVETGDPEAIKQLRIHP